MATDAERLETTVRNTYSQLEAMVTRLEHAQSCNDDPEDCEEVTRDMLEDCDVADSETYHDEDNARDSIAEDALSVEVRSDWTSYGETLEAAEFRIVITTGGPHIQIRGELDSNNTPCRAWLEYNDWFQEMRQFFDASQDTLLAYAQEFYFGW